MLGWCNSRGGEDSGYRLALALVTEESRRVTNKSFLRLSLLSGLLGIACATAPKAIDPHALPPAYDHWSAIATASRVQVYNTALRVLTDSAFRISRSDTLNGIIETLPRTQTDVRRGASQLRTGVEDAPVTLRFLVSTVTSNWTRLTISGDVQTTSGVSIPLVATDARWHLLSEIGDAVLARSRQ